MAILNPFPRLAPGLRDISKPAYIILSLIPRLIEYVNSQLTLSSLQQRRGVARVKLAQPGASMAILNPFPRLAPGLRDISKLAYIILSLTPRLIEYVNSQLTLSSLQQRRGVTRVKLAQPGASMAMFRYFPRLAPGLRDISKPAYIILSLIPRLIEYVNSQFTLNSLLRRRGVARVKLA